MRYWMYKCDAGYYKAPTLIGLVYEIFKHRLHHLIKDGVLKD